MSSPRSTLLLLFISAVIFAVSAASTFDDSNPILLASDGLRQLHDEFVQVLGDVRHVRSFARFAFRHEKKYESVEEMRRRFEIFAENKKLIRSTNRKGLSYKLGVNRETGGNGMLQ